MASTPTSADVGVSQLPNGSPGVSPTGTRPLAIAPAAAPRKNGVTIDESPKTRSAVRRPRSPPDSGHDANAGQHTTTPEADPPRATDNVAMVAAKDGAKAVPAITRQTI